MMNRYVALFLVAASICVNTHAADSTQRTVRIYNWIEYLPTEVLKDFEAETGIHPVYDVFDSVEMLQSKLLTGSSGYDVTFLASSTLDKIIKAQALEPLDRSKLDNWKHLDPVFMQTLAATGDEGNKYGVPYMWGTTLIGYNVDKVRTVLGADAKLDTWDLVFKKENMEKLAKCGVAFIDAADEVVPITLHYLGLESNSSVPEDYKKAQNLLMNVRPYVAYFNSSRWSMDLANGDICLAVGWSGTVGLAQKLAVDANKGIQIEMVTPKEGVPMWSDVMVIPKAAPHSEEAHIFINYMTRPDVIAKASNQIGYPNANKDATSLIAPAIRDNPNMYIPADKLAMIYPIKPIPMAIERIRTRTWNMVRTGH